MKVVVPCTICTDSKLECGCETAVLSYFKLLQRVQERVLTSKASSVTPHLEVKGAGVDKLNATFRTPILVKDVLEACQRNKLVTKRVSLKDRKPYLVVTEGSTSVHLKLDYDGIYLSGLVSNPNKFGQWEDYFEFIRKFLPNSTLSSTIINRVDLNIDFKCQFSTLIQSIDIKNKRKALTFQDEGGDRTGIIIGKGAETIVIYDKAKKDNNSSPHSRLELRLKQRKLPTQSIESLPQVLRDNNFFDGIEGVNLDFISINCNHPKLLEFKANLNRDGFYSVRKILSKNRNFKRDFEKHIEVNKWDIQLSDLFKNVMKEYFSKSEVHYH